MSCNLITVSGSLAVLLCCFNVQSNCLCLLELLHALERARDIQEMKALLNKQPSYVRETTARVVCHLRKLADSSDLNKVWFFVLENIILLSHCSGFIDSDYLSMECSPADANSWPV